MINIENDLNQIQQINYKNMQIETIEQKQKLLRSEIMHVQGIDPQGFMDYMGEVKGEGENIDLDNWTIAELKTVIAQYKRRLNQSKIQLMQSRLSKDLKRSSIFIEAKKQKFKYEGTNLWDFQEKYEQQCSKSEQVFQLKKILTPKIQIQKWQIKSVGGFIFGIGAKNELEFAISSNFTSRKIMRKNEDCDWLKKILSQKYVGVYTPPLTESIQFSTDDKKGINARIEEVNLFLNTLLSYSFFLYSNDFKEFMTQQQYKKFVDYRTRQTNFILQKALIQVQTPNGLFNVEISEKMNQNIKKSAQITQDLNNLYAELGPSLNQVISNVDAVGRSIRNYYDLTSKIGQRYNQIQKILNHQFKLPTILLSINSSIEATMKNLRLNVKALYTFSDTYIKPSVKDFNELLQASKRQQSQFSSYLNFKQNLIRKKQKFVNDPTKWQLPEADFLRIQRLGRIPKGGQFDLMFPNDNQRENRMRIWLSFVNQNYLKSLKLFFTQHEKSLLQTYLTFTQNYLASSVQINQSYEAFKQIFGIQCQ